MNIFDTMVLILMKNNGSYMSYDPNEEEFVIIFKKGKILIPVECYLIGIRLHECKTDKKICRIFVEDK